MFGKRIDLFRLFGFPVRLDVSWFLVAALIAWRRCSLRQRLGRQRYGMRGAPTLANGTHLKLPIAFP